MRKYIAPLIIIGFVFFAQFIFAQTTSSTLNSEKIGDVFKIYVTLPPNYNAQKSYPVIYYMDASIVLGTKVREIAPQLMKTKALESSILIGVGHIGSFKVKRRRDFLPLENEGKTANYGQADRFFDFLKKELQPFVQKRYKTNGQSTFIGHSFSGLLGMYMLFKKDSLFDYYIVISPSLWANNQNIYAYEKAYYEQSKTLNAKLFLSAGSLEEFNWIMPNVRKIDMILKDRKYENLEYRKKVIRGATHISVIDDALKYGLQSSLPTIKMNKDD